MPSKRISIDDEAFGRLDRIRRPGESISDVIKRVVHDQASAAEWLQTLEGRSLDEAAFEAIEQQIENRRQPSRRKR